MKTAAEQIPALDELAEYRWDRECYEVAAAIARKWPQLAVDAGFYVGDDGRPGDHGWNIAADGTIIDMTATQHSYTGSEDEQDEDYVFAAPPHAEIIPPSHPDYDRYVSWTRHEQRSQQIAHEAGHHDGCQSDYADICELCRAAA